jgi:hypothetical protein
LLRSAVTHDAIEQPVACGPTLRRFSAVSVRFFDSVGHYHFGLITALFVRISANRIAVAAPR